MSHLPGAVVKVENLRRWNSVFSVGPSHEGRAHQALMRLNIPCHICLSFSICRPTCVLLMITYIKHNNSAAEDLRTRAGTRFCDPEGLQG